VSFTGQEDYQLSEKIYRTEANLTNYEVVSRINNGQLHLCQEIKWWQQRYGLDKNKLDINREVVSILDGRVSFEDQGLSQSEKTEVKEQLEKIPTLSLDNLIDLIKS